MAIVYGFAGLRITEDGIAAVPFVPKDWNGYSFKFRYKGSLVKFAVTKEKTDVLLEEGEELELKLYGKMYRLTDKGVHIVAGENQRN